MATSTQSLWSAEGVDAASEAKAGGTGGAGASEVQAPNVEGAPAGLGAPATSGGGGGLAAGSTVAPASPNLAETAPGPALADGSPEGGAAPRVASGGAAPQLPGAPSRRLAAPAGSGADTVGAASTLAAPEPRAGMVSDRTAAAAPQAEPGPEPPADVAAPGQAGAPPASLPATAAPGERPAGDRLAAAAPPAVTPAPRSAAPAVPPLPELPQYGAIAASPPPGLSTADAAGAGAGHAVAPRVQAHVSGLPPAPDVKTASAAPAAGLPTTMEKAGLPGGQAAPMPVKLADSDKAPTSPQVPTVPQVLVALSGATGPAAGLARPAAPQVPAPLVAAEARGPAPALVQPAAAHEAAPGHGGPPAPLLPRRLAASGSADAGEGARMLTAPGALPTPPERSRPSGLPTVLRPGASSPSGAALPSVPQGAMPPAVAGSMPGRPVQPLPTQGNRLTPGSGAAGMGTEAGQDSGAGNGAVGGDATARSDLPPLLRYAVPSNPPPGLPRLAVILIDEGSPAGAEALRRLPIPVTVAVDASAADATATMRRWRDAGDEVVALAPLPAGAQPGDVAVALEGYRDAVPEAVALMEARPDGLQAAPGAAAQVVDSLASAGLGLVTWDGRLDRVRQLAEAAGVPEAGIYRRIDGQGRGQAAIGRFIDQAAFRAGIAGDIIVVGTVSATTVAALSDWLDSPRARSVAIVPLTAVLTDTGTGASGDIGAGPYR